MKLKTLSHLTLFLPFFTSCFVALDSHAGLSTKRGMLSVPGTRIEVLSQDGMPQADAQVQVSVASNRFRGLAKCLGSWIKSKRFEGLFCEQYLASQEGLAFTDAAGLAQTLPMEIPAQANPKPWAQVRVRSIPVEFEFESRFSSRRKLTCEALSSPSSSLRHISRTCVPMGPSNRPRPQGDGVIAGKKQILRAFAGGFRCVFQLPEVELKARIEEDRALCRQRVQEYEDRFEQPFPDSTVGPREEM